MKNYINIRYGDIIQLKYEKIGFMMSPAIHDDTNIYVQAQDDNKPCPNYYDFNFELLTRINFESAQSLNTYQDYLRETESSRRTPSSEEEKKEEEKKLDLLLKRAEKEEKMNVSMITFKNGKDLLYGETVILKHAHSSKFLRTDDTQIIKDVRTCRIHMDDEVDEKCLFKVIAGYEFRVDGHQVQKGDLIILYNEKTNRYVHVSDEKEMLISMERCVRFPMRMYSHPEPFIKRDNTEFAFKYPCNAMIDEYRNVRFTIVLYRPFEETENVVYAGDLVKFYHTDHKGYLCAELVVDENLKDKISDSTDLPLFVLKNDPKYDNDFEKEHCGSIFEIEYYNDFKSDQLIVDREPYGRPCLYETPDGQKPRYALKHLITGSFICSKYGEYKKFPCLSEFMDNSTSEEKIRKTVITTPLNIVSKNQSKSPYIYYNDNMQIENRYEDEDVDKKIWKDHIYLTDNKEKNSGTPKEYTTEGSVEGFNEDNKFFVPMNDSSQIKVHTCYDKTSNNKDTFSIRKVPIEQVTKVKMVLQAIYVFRLYVSRLRDPDTREAALKDKDMVKRVDARIDKMIFFIFDVDERDVRGDAESLEKIPLKQHQKVFRDLNLMESLVDILQFTVKSFSNFEPALQAQVFKIINKIYRLTRFTVKDYNQNQLYVAQWMNFFFSHVDPNLLAPMAPVLGKSVSFNSSTPLAPLSNLLKPETVLTIVYSNNIDILNKVEDKKIKQIMDYLIDNAMHERYLNILASMCNCQEHPMILKQKSIVDLLFEKVDGVERIRMIRMDVVVEDQTLYVVSEKLGGKVQFDSAFIFAPHSTPHAEVLSQNYAYLLAYIDLLSALCDGSFKDGIKLAKREWQVDKITTILTLDTNFKFKVKLINLCKKIYLDGYTENILIEYVNTTYYMPDVEQGHTDLFIRYNDKTDPDVYMLKDMVKYILTRKRKSVEESGNLEYHYVCNSILKLFKGLLDYGYVLNSKEISFFAAILIHNLDSRYDYPPDLVVSIYKPTYDNMVIFENKKMMCDMLNNILSIRVNVVNQYFLNIISLDSRNPELVRLYEPLEEVFQSEEATIRAYLNSGVKKNPNDHLVDLSNESEEQRDIEYVVRNKPYWDLTNCIQDLPIKVNIFSKTYLSILADLLKFQDNELLNKALQNLFKEFKFKKQIISNLAENHIIMQDDCSEHIYYWTLRLKSTYSSAIEHIKSYITYPTPEQSEVCFAKLKVCAQYMWFLIKNAISDHENIIAHASTIPSPLDVDIYYEEMNKIGFKKTLEYLQFIISYTKHEVYLRWFEIYRNCYVYKAVLEFLFHPSIFTDVQSAGILDKVKHKDMTSSNMFSHSESNAVPFQSNHVGYDPKLNESIYAANDDYDDENYYVRHISYIKPHLLMFLIYFSMANEKNKRSLLPWVSKFVDNGSYKLMDPKCIDCQYLFNKLAVQIVISYQYEFKKYSKILIQNLAKFIKEHWKEGNWEVVLSIDCLRDLIYFYGEPQKENQILILIEVDIRFLSECLDALQAKVVEWTNNSNIKLDQYYEDKIPKRKNSAEAKGSPNPYTYGYWSKDTPIKVPYKIKFYERIMMLMNDLVSGKNEATVTQIRKALTLDRAREIYPKLGFYYIAKWMFNSLLLNLYFDSDKDDSQIYSYIQDFIKYFDAEIDQANVITSMPYSVETCSKYRLLKLSGLIRVYDYNDYLNFITDCIIPFNYLLKSKVSGSDLMHFADVLRALYKAMAMDFNIFNSYSKGFEYVLYCVSVNDSREEFRQLANEVFDITFNSEWGNAKLRAQSDVVYRRKFSLRTLVTIFEPNQFENTVLSRLKMLENNELLNREYNEDFNSLVCYLSSLDDKTGDIFIKVINILLEGDRVLSEDTVKNLLNLLRRIIENANKTKTNKDIFDWDTADCEFDKPINDKQDKLQKMGACEMIFKVFLDYNDSTVRDECIKLAIALLYSGNEDIQTWFCNKFESPRKTEFFKILVSIIESNFDIVSKFEVSKITSFLEKAMLMDDEEVDSDAGQLQNIGDNQTEYDKHIEIPMQIVIRTMRFMQLLCENHNHDLQDKLRYQETGNSVNVVEVITKVFGKYLKIFNKRNLRLGIQLLTTMVEIIQGPNKANQNKLVEDKVVDNVRDIMFFMRKDENLEKKGIKNNDDEIVTFNTKVMILLTSLLEGNCDYDLTLKIYKSCEFTILTERLRCIFIQYCRDTLNVDLEVLSYDQIFKIIRNEYNTYHYTYLLSLKEGFNIAILMLHIINMVDDARMFVQNFHNMRDKQAFDFFSKNTGNVEIAISDDLFTIHFPILPVCRNLSSMTIDKFTETVDRENYVSKITGLLKNYPYFLKEMQLNEELLMASKDSVNILSPFYVKVFADMSFTIAWIQNLMILIFIRRYRCGTLKDGYTYEPCPDGGTCFKNFCNYSYMDKKTDFYFEHWYYWVSSFFGILQTFTALMLLLIWFKTKSKLTTYIHWHQIIIVNREEYRRENKAKGMDDNEIKKNLDATESAEALIENSEREMELLYLKGPWCSEFMLNTPTVDGDPHFYHLYSYLNYEYTNIESVITNYDFGYQVMSIVFSLSGNLVHEFFYAYNLLDIIKRYPALQNVVKSVTENVTELSLTIFFMMIINYTFSGIAFQYFGELYQIDGYESMQPVLDSSGEYIDYQPKIDSPCDYMKYCFFQTFNFGLKNGGGVGDALVVVSDIHPLFYNSFVFIMSYFFWVSVLLLNVIFGTIINTFAELRNNRVNQESDMKNLCFICSLSRDEIDRIGQPFEYHVEHVHNKLYYAYYLVHMDYKNSTEYDGIESKVYDKRIAGDFSWIPQQTTKKLRDHEAAEDDTNLIKDIQDDIEDVDGTLDLVFEKLNRLR